MPMPKGGRKNQDIVLCEDQLLYGVRARLLEDMKKKRAKEARMQEDMDGYVAGQSVQFVQGKKQMSIENNIRLHYGVGKKNPNAMTRPRYAKKKKHNH